MTITTDSDLYTLTQRTLRNARDAGQEDLLALYGQAMLRVSGGLA